MFKSKSQKWLDKNSPIFNKNFSTIYEDMVRFKEITNSLYELYEGLGQKIKNNKEDIDTNKVDISVILIGILKHLDLVVNDQGEVVKKPKIKIKKDAVISTPTKNNKRKSK